MNSKEYLAQLEKTINTFEKNKLNEFGFSMSIEMAKDILNTFNQDLERLEVLERNSDKVIKDSVKLINRNLELQQENEKLKKAIEIIIEKDVNIQILLNSFRFELGLEFYNKHDFIYEQLTQQEYELLKEVLCE